MLDALHWRKHTPKGRDLRKTLIPEDVQPYPTALEQAVTACIGVTSIGAAAFRGSGLTRAALRGGTFRGVYAMGDLAAEMITAVQRPGPQLVYGYHADLDMLGHGHGPGALPWRLQLRQIDGLAALVAEALPSDAVLLVTADHGMVAVDRTFDADTHPDLRRNVSAVGGDGRARHVYAKSGAAADVLATWRSVLGDAGWVVPGEQAIAEGWFGPLGPHVVGPHRRRGRGRPRLGRRHPYRGRADDLQAARPARLAVGRGAAHPPAAPPPRLSPSCRASLHFRYAVSRFSRRRGRSRPGGTSRKATRRPENGDSPSPKRRLAATETETRRQVGVMR